MPSDSPRIPKFTAPVRRGLGQLLKYWQEDHMYEMLDDKHPGVRRLKASQRRDTHAAITWAMAQVRREDDKQRARDAAGKSRRGATPAGEDQTHEHRQGQHDEAGEAAGQAQSQSSGEERTAAGSIRLSVERPSGGESAGAD